MRKKVKTSKRITTIVITLLLFQLVSFSQNMKPKQIIIDKTIIGTIDAFYVSCCNERPWFRVVLPSGKIIKIEAGPSEAEGGGNNYLEKEILDQYRADSYDPADKGPSIEQKKILWKIKCKERHYCDNMDYFFYKLTSLKRYSNSETPPDLTKIKEPKLGIDYTGLYFMEEKGYKCYILQKNGQYYFSYSNSISEAHKLDKTYSVDLERTTYKCAWTGTNGLSTTIDLNFDCKDNNVIVYIKSFYRGHTSEDLYFKDKNIPGSKKIFYSVTYINSTPSTGIEFKVSYSNSPVFLGNNPKHTDINVAKGVYLIKFKLLGDGDSGWYSYRSGKITINKDKTIDFFKDVYSITEIDESTYNKGFN